MLNMRLPEIDADDYEVPAVLAADSPTATPQHGTSVQAGWGAAEAPKKSGNYPTAFKFTPQTQVVAFLEDSPFAAYKQHWIERSAGKRSFVCLKPDSDCPLCAAPVNNVPNQKYDFNVVVLTDEEPEVKILTTGTMFARDLMTANDDPVRGPLTKSFWAIARHGTGNTTRFSLERVRPRDLAEEWQIDPEKFAPFIADAQRYTLDSVYVSPYEELVKVAESFQQG
jgi:hypothetical protein